MNEVGPVHRVEFQICTVAEDAKFQRYLSFLLFTRQTVIQHLYNVWECRYYAAITTQKSQ